MEINELLKAKWSYFFDILDVNNDGLVEKKDFTELAEKIFVVYEANGRNIGMKVLLKKADRLFNRLLFEMHLMHKNEIERIDWFKWLELNAKMGEESHAYKRLTYNIFKELFNVCDQNGDGFLSRQELTDLYEIFGIQSSDASFAFSYIDENNDGKISRSEFLDGIREFFIDMESNQTIFGLVKSSE